MFNMVQEIPYLDLFVLSIAFNGVYRNVFDLFM
jgi:hypothetical protein